MQKYPKRYRSETIKRPPHTRLVESPKTKALTSYHSTIVRSEDMKVSSLPQCIWQRRLLLTGELKQVSWPLLATQPSAACWS